MPRVGRMGTFTWWNAEQKEEKNTEFHQLIKEEIRTFIPLGSKVIEQKIIEFKKKHPGFFED